MVGGARVFRRRMNKIKIFFTLWAVGLATLLMGDGCRAAVHSPYPKSADMEFLGSEGDTLPANQQAVDQQKTNQQEGNTPTTNQQAVDQQKNRQQRANQQELFPSALYGFTPSSTSGGKSGSTSGEKSGSLEEIASTAPVGAESLAGDHAADVSTQGWAGKWSRLVEGIKLQEVRGLIWGGLYTTAIIFFFAAIFAILLAMFLAYLGITQRCKLLYKPLQWFVVKIRDVPAVILMMFFYYVLFSGKMNGIVVSIIALGVYTAGSLSVTFISAIKKVGQGQVEAGRVLGLSVRQCYRHIILPQAVKGILPQIVSALKIQLRATTYAGYVAQKDLVKAVDAIRIYTIDNTIPLILIAILFLIMGWIISNVIAWLYKQIFTYD